MNPKNKTNQYRRRTGKSNWQIPDGERNVKIIPDRMNPDRGRNTNTNTNRSNSKREGNARAVSSRTQMKKAGQRKPIKSRWYKKRRRKKWLRLLKQNAVPLAILFLLAIGMIYLLVYGIWSLLDDSGQTVKLKTETVTLDGEIEQITVECPELDVRLLTVNKYSRPGTKLKQVNGIVIHYVGNPGTTAAQNRSYFESLKDTHEASASSHFVVGMDGEIIQCIPTSEISYCSNERNEDTIAIECCHEKKDGKFTEETYSSLVHLTAFLCCKFDLEIEDVIRHYDVTGKECPKYFVSHEEKWIRFKKDVAEYIEEHGHVAN